MQNSAVFLNTSKWQLKYKTEKDKIHGYWRFIRAFPSESGMPQCPMSSNNRDKEEGDFGSGCSDNSAAMKGRSLLPPWHHTNILYLREDGIVPPSSFKHPHHRSNNNKNFTQIARYFYRIPGNFQDCQEQRNKKDWKTNTDPKPSKHHKEQCVILDLILQKKSILGKPKRIKTVWSLDDTNAETNNSSFASLEFW